MAKQLCIFGAAALALVVGCAQPDSGPPKAAPKASLSTDAGKSSADAKAPHLSPLAQLSAQGDTDGDVRNSQLKNLQAQHDSYLQQMVTLQASADQLFNSDVSIQRQGVAGTASMTTGAAGVGAGVAVAGGVLGGVLTGDWASAALAAVPTAASLLGSGVAGDTAEAKAMADSKAVSADVQAQRNIILVRIADLQAKIDGINAEIKKLGDLKL